MFARVLLPLILILFSLTCVAGDSDSADEFEVLARIFVDPSKSPQEEQQRIDALFNFLKQNVGDDKRVLKALRSVRKRLNEKEEAAVRAAEENQKLKNDLKAAERKVEIDPLTGIHNSSAFQRKRRATDEPTNAQTNKMMGFLLLDIDKFKNINDTHGHPFGNEVLQKVARAVRDNVRDAVAFPRKAPTHAYSEDDVMRVGGEEFAVLLPQTSLQDTTKVAERLLSLIASLEFSIPGVKVTASFGVAAGPINDSKDFDAYYKAADEGLYMAKNQGRNRVVPVAIIGNKVVPVVFNVLGSQRTAGSNATNENCDAALTAENNGNDPTNTK